MRVQHNESMPLSRKPPTKKGKLDDGSDLGPSGMVMYHDELLDSSNAMYDPALLATGTPVPSAPIASGSATPRTTTPFPAAHPQLPPAPTPAEQDEDEPDDPEIAQAIDANPKLPPDQVRYLCYLARHRYANQEREGLLDELGRLEAKWKAITEEKDNMLDTIFRAEIGMEVEGIIRPIKDEDIAPLKWSLTNRTSLPNIGVRDVKATRYDDDEE